VSACHSVVDRVRIGAVARRNRLAAGHGHLRARVERGEFVEIVLRVGVSVAAQPACGMHSNSAHQVCEPSFGGRQSPLERERSAREAS
jgi:hypothetical protein